MKYFFLIIAFVSFACASQKRISNPGGMAGRLSIDLDAPEGKFSLNGMGYFSADSNYLNVYGPFSINLVRLKTEGDSIWVVDMQNKKLYRSVYRNASPLLHNLFRGVYSAEEEKLICALYLFAKNEVLCKGVNKKWVNYKFRKSGGNAFIGLEILNERNNYRVDIKMNETPRTNISSSFKGKFLEYETIMIKLQ